MREYHDGEKIYLDILIDSNVSSLLKTNKWFLDCYLYVCMYVCVCVCMYVCLSVCLSTCMYV
jgi:hypothetical protein